MKYKVNDDIALEIVVGQDDVSIINNSVSVGHNSTRIYGAVDSSGNKVSKPIHIHIDKNTPTITSHVIDIVNSEAEVTINLGTKLLGL